MKKKDATEISKHSHLCSRNFSDAMKPGGLAGGGWILITAPPAKSAKPPQWGTAKFYLQIQHHSYPQTEQVMWLHVLSNFCNLSLQTGQNAMRSYPLKGASLFIYASSHEILSCHSSLHSKHTRVLQIGHCSLVSFMSLAYILPSHLSLVQYLSIMSYCSNFFSFHSVIFSKIGYWSANNSLSWLSDAGFVQPCCRQCSFRTPPFSIKVVN